MENRLRNEIICGNAIEELKIFESRCVDLAITDPPYLVNYKDSIGRSVANDANAEGVLPAFDKIYRVLKNDSLCISIAGWTALNKFTKAWSDAGFRIVGHIVWTKDYASNKGQTAYVLAKGRPKLPAKAFADVQDWVYSGNRFHPTEKSVEIIAPLIRAFSKPDDVILDPFLGSGTTAVAAALTDRGYIGIELEQKYCDLANRRLEGVKRFKQKDNRMASAKVTHTTSHAA